MHVRKHAMQKRMMIWDDVRLILAIHRAGSLSGAARGLQINQSTVGRRLAALEQRLQTRMLFLGAQGYRLSRDGERLLPQMERMEEEALRLERELLGAQSRLSGSVTLSGPDAFAAQMLVPILARFKRSQPGIDVELLCDERNADLRQREADLALRIQRPQEGSLISRRVAPFCFAVYASESYRAERGPLRARLEGHDFVAVRRAVSEAWQHKHAQAARVVFRTNSTAAHLNAVREGMGIGILPCYAAAREPSLTCLARPDASLSRALWLVMHRDLRASVRVRALADFVARELAQLAPVLEKP